MSRQVMIGMLKDAKEAVATAGLYNYVVNQLDQTSFPTEGTQNLIGQLIMAAAIEQAGRKGSI